MSSVLKKWNNEYHQKFSSYTGVVIRRREFLFGLAKSSAVATAFPFSGLLQSCSNEQAIHESEREPWLTIASVQQHLFPADGNGPSAEDINANRYLKTMLDQPDTDKQEREFIVNGVSWLNDYCKEQLKTDFISTSETSQQDILKKVAQSEAGENWLSTLMLYIVEALLTDPVYGGNPAQIGWKWLEHQPGYPRPPKNKKYMYLK